MNLDDRNDRAPLFPDDNPFELKAKVMLMAIISILLVVAIVILLHIYARCVRRRQARNRDAIRRLRFGVAMAQIQSRELPQTGLDPSIIASLPRFIYKLRDVIDENAIIECAVCLSSLEEEEMVMLLPNCKHIFHEACIDMWLSSNSTCPICRTGAEPLPHPKAERSELVGEVPTTAQPLESVNSTTSSFRMMVGRETSSKRSQEDGVEDLERQ